MELGDEYFKGTSIIKPREKALRQGIESLSDSELVSLLLDTGNTRENVVSLSSRMLYEKGGLRGIFLNDDNNLETKGVKKAKMCRLLAVREIMRRLPFSREETYLDDKTTYERCRNFFLGRKSEIALVLYLNKEKKLIRKDSFTSGSDESVYVPVSLVVKTSLQCNARFVLVLHNHPSGKLHPSFADIQVAKELFRSLSLAQVVLLDVLIVSDCDKLSFRKNHYPPF